LAAPDISERLLAGLDALGGRHLLVLLAPEEADFHDAQSRGIGVVTRELALSAQLGRYLDISCQDSAGHAAFDLIGGELADRLSTGEAASESVARLMAKWRRFWGQLPRQLLSRQDQLGLFAELWFLSVWLIPKVGASEAMKRWRGPFASRHDFEWSSGSVEVKATTSTRGPIHRINGIDQLAAPGAGELFLFSLRVREEAGATNSLPAVILTCRGQLGTNADALNRFEAALAAAGYSPIYENEYAETRLRIVEEGLFIVRNEFPRLTPPQLLAGLPPGVERLEYEINLSGFAHLCIARLPADAAQL
jgi:hypothetical protein